MRGRSMSRSPSVVRFMAPTPAQRGFVRTGGFYGRYGTSRSGSAAERKFFDTVLTDTAIDLTGETLTSLNLIPQGVTEATRVGRKCVIRSIDITGFINWAPTAGMTVGAYGDSQVMLVLVLDKQCNGANAAWTDVWEANSVITPRDLANTDRFVVLKRWNLVPDFPVVTTADNWATAGNTIVQPRQQKIKPYHKKCKIPIEFSSTTGAITEVRSNNLILMAMSNVLDDQNTVSAYCRVRFED